MATPESKVKRQLDTMLKGEGVWFFSPQAGPYGVAGIPDRIAIVCGTFLGIECKADAKCKMTALQERCKEQIEDAGGTFFLVYDKATIEQVRQWIVSTRNRRQEEGGSGVGKPGSHPVLYPYGASGSVQTDPDTRAALYRSYPSIEEFRARRTEPDQPLL